MALAPSTRCSSRPSSCSRRRACVAIFDVDGVLTDGRIYIGEQGEAFKAFSTLDGHGLKLLARGGITPVVITGRDSAAVRRRVADLGIRHAVYGAGDKLVTAAPCSPRSASTGPRWRRWATTGPTCRCCPRRLRLRAGRRPRRGARHRPPTRAEGGHGAARGCDLLLMAAGRYADLLQGHLVTLDGGAAP
jgi:3-deoxy-D-manno-octulosonate 8-phosphate phosphatase (KDO 8-P phosphatase)